jgi:hypothetical protein
MKFKALFLLFFLPVFSGYGYFCVDRDFTSYSGAENLLSVQQSIERIDSLIHPSPTITLEDIQNPERCPTLLPREQWIRYAKSLFVWTPINTLLAVTQHEVFGHGYRARDLGTEFVEVTGYKMYVFAGATALEITDKLTTSQMITINIAGLEAGSVLANKTRLEWLTNGKMSGKRGMLYLYSALSPLTYAFTVKENPTAPPVDGNDISGFLYFLNTTYQDSYLSYTKTRNLSFINLLDPFVYYSLISQLFYVHLSTPINILMFNLGPVQYLPSARVALTPFGLQGYFENFFLINKIPTYLYFKWGQNGPNQYWGLGVENQKILHWKSGSLGLRMDIWNQPHVLFEPGALSVVDLYNLPSGSAVPQLYPPSVLHAKSLGAAFSIMAAQSLVKWPLQLYLELGYKTTGYLPGEALRESPIARGGFSGQF